MAGSCTRLRTSGNSTAWIFLGHSDNNVSKQRMLCEKWSIYFSTTLMKIITLYSGLLPSLKTQTTLICPMYKNSWKKNRIFKARLGAWTYPVGKQKQLEVHELDGVLKGNLGTRGAERRWGYAKGSRNGTRVRWTLDAPRSYLLFMSPGF